MALKSFVDVASESHVSLENLPFSAFKSRASEARIGVALGDYVVDLAALERAGLFKDLSPETAAATTRDSLNELLALGRPAWRKVRETLQKLLSAETATLRDDETLRERVFHRQSDVVMQLPAKIGNYTDFYSSYHHAYNVGTMLRGPENALMPNWKWLARQDPEPLLYLRAKNDSTFDIQLEAKLQTAKMKSPHSITQTNFQNLYWSVSQQLAHHTVGGCNLQPGDLLASGTISGETEESRGCMLELTWRGANPLKLPNGETRKWLEDGDTLKITGWCNGDGYRIGFGEVSGKILPAH